MKLKISEVAKELGLKSKEVIDIAKELGIKASTRGGIDPMDAMKIEEYLKSGKPKKSEPKEKKQEEVKKEKPKRKKKFHDLIKDLKKPPKKVEKEEKKEEKPVEKKTKKQPPKPQKKKEEVKKELKIDMDLAEMDVIEENQVELLDLYFNDISLRDDEELEKKAKKTDNAKKENKKQQTIKKQKAAKTSGGITKENVKKKRKKKKKEATQEVIKIPKEVRVYEFAEAIKKPIEEVLNALRELGEERDKNDFLGEEYIETLAEEFGAEVEIYDPLAEFDYVKKYEENCPEDEYDTPRPPIVTIMGHVDHGKTSLLDKIRNSRVAAKEAGGITQHIGAYMVEKDGKKITFIDTPGHEAFTEMRARGAKVTDIAIIVVAADDGVMPQTKEAISHVQAAGVPFIVAVNKIDKPQANPDLVKSQLAEMGIMPVEWGGDIEFVHVSAMTGEGIDDLLETILLQAELMELKANPKCPAKAVVIESRVEKGKGPVATVIVNNGTLKKQESFVCGKTYGRVRLIINDMGKQIKEVLPGEPAEITGFDEVPLAGDTLVVVESDKIAKDTAEKWKEFLEEREKSKTTKATLEDLQKMILEGNLKKLPVIIKADTQGSVEAIKGSLAKLKNDEVKVDIIHSDVGAITENDVILAKASEPNAIVLGFNVRPTSGAKNKAKQEGIEIRTYSIIYDLIDDVKELLSGLMTPKIKENVTATVEVRDVFNVPKIGTVAGCYVQDGVVHRGDFVRVIRDGVVIYDSKLASLKRFKDDVKEVGKGFECGIMVEGYNDVKVGDILETYQKIEEKAKFE
ncbi:MAG: translation initiation factor IF-2 [Epsilonproteobacteria bacterium]|nr:translation initiation factor IF-2 [Campylobacterota bacterium]